MLWTWFLLLPSSTTGWTFYGTVQPRTFHELEDRKETFWRKSSSLSWTRNMIGRNMIGNFTFIMSTLLFPDAFLPRNHEHFMNWKTEKRHFEERAAPWAGLETWSAITVDQNTASRMSMLRGSKWKLRRMWTGGEGLEGHGHWSQLAVCLERIRRSPIHWEDLCVRVVLWGAFNLMVKKLYFQGPKIWTPSLRQSALR